MQIHDLNTKALTNPAYVAFDDGTDTYKADFKAEIDNAAASAVADADLTENTVAFTSGDAASPTEWTAVDVLKSGLPIKALFSRISTMIKNIRWLYSKLGTTDISSIGGGTVTGAISSLNSKTIPISQGGTGGTSFAAARNNLGITHNTLYNVNLDDYKGIDASGLYYISTGVQNTPSSWSWLIIVGGAGTAQIVIQTNAIYVRAYTGNPLAWTTWTKAALTSV